MEGTVGNSEEGAELGVVGVLAIALQKSERCDEVALLEEVVSVWQSELLLLLKGKDRQWLIKGLAFGSVGVDLPWQPGS